MTKVKQIVLLVSTVLSILILSVFFALYQWYKQPIDRMADSSQIFIIPKGQAIAVTGTRLYEAGLIKHPFLFRIAVKLEGLDGKIQAGSFELSPNQSVAEIAQTLTQGTQDIWVTIIEGWRKEEIAESLAKLDLPLFDPDEFIAIAKAESSEGRLFPETYLIPKQYDAQQVHDLLVSTFERKVMQALAEEIEANPYDFDQVLIMASLVERESREYEEMRGVAGVLWHRIEIGMPLQVDATMQYARGYNQEQQTWWAPPRAVDKTIDSPFNTYQINGLPPAPISNPSLNAIRASLNPVDTNNLFYIHDRSGKIHYAETLDGHNANVNRYLR